MRKISGRFGAVAGITALMGMMVVAAIASPAQTYSVIYSFSGSPDGANPYTGVVADQAGNLYGTTESGGNYSGICIQEGCGVVFKLDLSGTESVLYRFSGAADGARPNAGVIRDGAGNLYGTTAGGGIFDSLCATEGCGVIYRLDSAGNENVVHAFTGEPDGKGPEAALSRDAAGNLYGTTLGGGTYGDGTVFELKPAHGETVIHSFMGTDGQAPASTITRDDDGNLYSTTFVGGASGNGVVFKLDSSGNETVLHSFTGPDGSLPFAGVTLDAAGNLYGTTGAGGAVAGFCGMYYGCGVVFKVDAAGNETVLYSFTGTADGALPLGGLIRDAAGNLYGTTYAGGAYGAGVLFKVSPSGQETVLYTFTGGTDGGYPLATLVPYKNSLYGTAEFGGAYGQGVVFRLSLH